MPKRLGTTEITTSKKIGFQKVEGQMDLQHCYGYMSLDTINILWKEKIFYYVQKLKLEIIFKDRVQRNIRCYVFEFSTQTFL